MTERNVSNSICKPLPKEMRSLVRSGIAITNVAQCVEELVLNSVDAKATTIYVGVNLDNFSIRVEDNGIGLSKQDLEVIGSRYTTSKCQCLDDLRALRYYGYRGEALASIIDVSASVDIIGRTEDSIAPYRKRFVKGKVKGCVERQPESKKAQGVTVVVSNLLSELPVRQKRVEKSIQLEEIKSAIQRIVLINPSLSVELRNESKGTRLLEYSGFSSFADAFRCLYGNKSGLSHINLIEEHHLYNGLFFTACIGKETHRTKNFQLVYVNKRFVGRTKIHRHLNQSLSKIFANGNRKNDQKDNNNDIRNGRPAINEKYPVFIVNIKCPLDTYDITLEPKKMQVEFRDWDVLVKGLDGLVLCFHSTLQSTEKCKIVNVKQSSSFTKDEKFAKVAAKLRKSHSKPEEGSGAYGLSVTSHDVKRAIHSRFAVREPLADDGSDVTSNKSLTIQKSLGTASSGLELLSIDSSPYNITSKKRKSVESQPEVLTYRLKNRPTRTTTYDIRRLNSKRKTNNSIFPTGFQKPKIYVPKKPMLNAAIFKKFPQLDKEPNETKDTPKGTDSSQSVSVNEIPVKRQRKSSLEEQFGYKKKPVYSQVVQTSYKDAQNEKKRTLKGSMDDLVDVNRNPEMTDEEVSSWKWKINRYIQQCQLEKKVSEIEKYNEKELDDIHNVTPSKAETNSDVSVQKAMDKIESLGKISELEDRAQNWKTTTPITPIPDDKPDAFQDSPVYQSAENDTWAIDVANASMEQFAAKHLNGKNRLEEIRRDILRKIESSLAGIEFLRLVEGTDPDINLPIKSEISQSKNILKPATFGIAEFKNSLRPLNGFPSSGLGVKPVIQPPLFNQLPLKTPDPYGLNRVIKSRDSSFTMSNPSSSVSSKSPVKTYRFGTTSFHPRPFNSKPPVPQGNLEQEKSSVSFLTAPIIQPSTAVDSETEMEQDTSISSYFRSLKPFPSTAFKGLEEFASSGQDKSNSRSAYQSKTSKLFGQGQEDLIEVKAPNLFLNSQLSYPKKTDSLSKCLEQTEYTSVADKTQTQPEEDEWGDWEVDIVSDLKGQDWLQSEDEDGNKIYINLVTGASSYDMVNIIMETRISAGEAAKRNKNFRFDWLRRYFPKGSHKFWKPEGSKDKIKLEGNISLVGKDNVLGKVVVDYIKDSLNETASVKWRDGFLESFDQQNLRGHDETDGIRLSEYWNRPVGLSEVPVANLNAPEVKFWNKVKGNVQSSFRFSKSDLARVKVLTQLDRKFIVAKVSTLSITEKITDVLVLFDQHAVHERIRLERLLEESYVDGPTGQKEIKRFSIVPSMPLSFSETEIRIMQSYSDGFNAIGVSMEIISSSSVKIASAPKCFAEKVATETVANREPLMRKMLCSLLQEQVHHIIDTKGSFQSIPKTIFNILCSQACHGAIKFGDELELSVCQRMLNDLKNCKTPFQCAHGRPVLVPLLDLASLKVATDLEEPPMTHYDYTAETPDGTIELVSSQGNQKVFEEESSYFESSSGYFSSAAIDSNIAPMTNQREPYEFSLFNQ